MIFHNGIYVMKFFSNSYAIHTTKRYGKNCCQVGILDYTKHGIRLRYEFVFRSQNKTILLLNDRSMSDSKTERKGEPKIEEHS